MPLHSNEISIPGYPLRIITHSTSDAPMPFCSLTHMERSCFQTLASPHRLQLCGGGAGGPQSTLFSLPLPEIL